MTRLLHLIETADPRSGGPVEAAVRLGRAWAEAGHVQDLVTLDPPDGHTLPDYPGRVTAIGPARGRSPAARYRYDPGVVPWLRAQASAYDAVIVSGLWRYQARAGWRALAGGGVPYFAMAHGMLDPWFRRRYPLKHFAKQVSWWCAEGPLLAHARAVIFTCEEERRLAIDAFRPYRANPLVSPLGTADVRGDAAAQVAAFRRAVPALGDRRFLLFLGRLHPKKGCDLLVEAFAGVAAQDAALDLVMAGPDQAGLADRLAARASALGVAARVHWPGMLRGEAKAGAYRAADAFVLPSHQENFGLTVAEALACGTPVLLSDRVNIWREVAVDGAALVAPDTLTGTATLLARFLALSPAERAGMRVAARACFLRRFRIEAAAAALMRQIEARI